MYKRKVGTVLLVTFLVNAVLVASHEGEFWPFSIYPMFSQAGKPWTRAILRDVSQESDSTIWTTHQYPDLPGKPVSTIAIGIDQIDFSNFVVKTKEWNKKRSDALLHMISQEELQGKKFLAIKVSGKLSDTEGVDASALPFLLLENDKTTFNPFLKESEYFKK